MCFFIELKKIIITKWFRSGRDLKMLMMSITLTTWVLTPSSFPSWVKGLVSIKLSTLKALGS